MNADILVDDMLTSTINRFESMGISIDKKDIIYCIGDRGDHIGIPSPSPESIGQSAEEYIESLFDGLEVSITVRFFPNYIGIYYSDFPFQRFEETETDAYDMFLNIHLDYDIDDFEDSDIQFNSLYNYIESMIYGYVNDYINTVVNICKETYYSHRNEIIEAQALEA